MKYNKYKLKISLSYSYCYCVLHAQNATNLIVEYIERHYACRSCHCHQRIVVVGAQVAGSKPDNSHVRPLKKR